MKTGMLTDVEEITIKDVERPEPGENEVLIRVKSTGVCGSDLHAYKGHHPFRTPPVILGHEVSGVVEEIGKNVSRFKKGDRVTVEPQEGCGNCEFCLQGDYNLCTDRKAPGVGDWYGTFAEYFQAPKNRVLKLSDSVSFAAGALIEPLAVGVHAVRKADIKVGDSVAILGAGTIGLMSLLAAKKAGATNILVTDLLDFNLEKARELGADYIINTENESIEDIKKKLPNGLDKIIITAAFPPVWEDAVKVSKGGGEICIVGMFGTEVKVDFLELLMGEKSVSTSWIYLREDFITAIEIADSCDLESIITHEFPLAEAESALRLLETRDENVIKIVLNT